jgi:sarcosine oxidase
MPEQQVDLAIVGLGAMGAAIAWQAAVRGLSVAGFDALDPPHTSGSTHGHSRIIREAYFEHPQYVPLVQRAYALWADLEAAAGTRLLQSCGGLMIGRPDRTVVDGTLRAASEHRLPVQTWAADDIRTRVPALAPDPDMVGVFEPRAGVLAPERAVGAMLDQARRAGARLFVSEPVRDWTSEAGHVDVRSASRHVRARRLVLAAGPWLASMLGGLTLPLVVERVVQYWYATAADDRFSPPRFPIFLLEAPDGRMLYGLPDQGRGLKLAEHHGGRPTTADAIDRQVSADERDAFHAFASRWLRDLPAGPADASVCLYTNTPDGDFLLDWHPAAPGVFVCSACSGHGFKFAPAIGEAVASVIALGASSYDLAPFRLARLTGAGTGTPRPS